MIDAALSIELLTQYSITGEARESRGLSSQLRRNFGSYDEQSGLHPHCLNALFRAAALPVSNNIAGALITGKARPCKRPGCRVRFVPNSGRQEYHNAWCREQDRKARK
jgi:hypothetical protein